jgi:hypothetical protein
MTGVKIKFSEVYSVKGDTAETTGCALEWQFQKYMFTDKFFSFIYLKTNTKFSGTLCRGRIDFI